jgi:hypothetical protein
MGLDIKRSDDMARKKNPDAVMGRPKKPIDKKIFESLCGIQCTLEEMCAAFEVTDKTLNSWCKETYGTTFSEVFKEKRELGKISLRRAGFKLAQSNPSVHIFYAKNHLGMTDKIEADFNPESLKRAKELLEGVDSVID